MIGAMFEQTGEVMSDYDVLVAGAGPVGLTLAMDLGRRGVRVGVVERRRRGELPSVKCNHVAARSMEAFRLLGIADAVRGAGLPADYPNDCVYRTTVTGREITRIPIPSRAERRSGFKGPDTDWPTPEPPHRINQIYLEPVLFDHALRSRNVSISSETELIEVDQDATAVHCRVRDLSTGETRSVTARYLVGCDGGRSLVRAAINARLMGDPLIQRVQSTYVRAPRLLGLIPGRPGWMNLSLNPRRCGNTIAIDGRETWLIHSYLYEHEEDFGGLDRDASIRTILGVGAEFEYQVLGKEDWVGRRLVSDSFRNRRIFLCGDSAHIWVPYAGYGMNAGIADAMNLSWLLAARLAGWAGEGALDAYMAERGPITEQVSHLAMDHALAALRHRREVPADIEAAGERGERARREFGEAVYALNVQQYCCGGLNFGYFYDCSPIIAYDGEPHPRYTMAEFAESTVPGCRTPHLWLAGDRSLYDAAGLGFTLLRFDPRVDISALVAAAASRRVPLEVLDIGPAQRRAVYREALVLSRPDFHIAWRGNSAPRDPLKLIDRLRGAGSD
jgi:2-polyprenyl-6-methoxyphenol hydroxylase-like FAD-dependent oxidoreductase